MSRTESAPGAAPRPIAELPKAQTPKAAPLTLVQTEWQDSQSRRLQAEYPSAARSQHANLLHIQPTTHPGATPTKAEEASKQPKPEQWRSATQNNGDTRGDTNSYLRQQVEEKTTIGFRVSPFQILWVLLSTTILCVTTHLKIHTLIPTSQIHSLQPHSLNQTLASLTLSCGYTTPNYTTMATLTFACLTALSTPYHPFYILSRPPSNLPQDERPLAPAPPTQQKHTAVSIKTCTYQQKYKHFNSTLKSHPTLSISLPSITGSRLLSPHTKDCHTSTSHYSRRPHYQLRRPHFATPTHQIAKPSNPNVHSLTHTQPQPSKLSSTSKSQSSCQCLSPLHAAKGHPAASCLQFRKPTKPPDRSLPHLSAKGHPHTTNFEPSHAARDHHLACWPPQKTHTKQNR